MTRIELTLKNILFVANVCGGETASIFSSPTSTCGRDGIDSQVYFMQLLTNLRITPVRQLAKWIERPVATTDARFVVRVTDTEIMNCVDAVHPGVIKKTPLLKGRSREAYG